LKLIAGADRRLYSLFPLLSSSLISSHPTHIKTDASGDIQRSALCKPIIILCTTCASHVSFGCCFAVWVSRSAALGTLPGIKVGDGRGGNFLEMIALRLFHDVDRYLACGTVCYLVGTAVGGVRRVDCPFATRWLLHDVPTRLAEDHCWGARFRLLGWLSVSSISIVLFLVTIFITCGQPYAAQLSC
jgi:hypothetical protein